MKSTPVYVFENESSLGIDTVPISAFVMIREIGSKLEPMLLTKVSNVGMGSISTIANFIADNTLYDVFKADSELEKIDGVTGAPAWRILGRNPVNYKAGDESIDFSASTSSSPTKGAQGYRSFAEGENTLASGAYSHAEGFNAIASGDYSHAEGRDTEASLEGSHASGIGTSAVSIDSVNYSTVLGRWNGSTRLGSANILQVGWGKDDANRSNIFEIDTCGLGDGPELRAPMTEVKDIVHNRALVTKEYLEGVLDSMWLGDLVDVTAIPLETNILGTDKFEYAGNTYYKFGDIVESPDGNIWRCIVKPKYLSYSDLSAVPPNPGGTQLDFDAEVALFYWTLVVDEYVAQNHLVVYDPVGGPIGSGCWENVQDLDMGYY